MSIAKPPSGESQVKPDAPQADDAADLAARSEHFHRLFDSSLVSVAMVSVDTGGRATILAANESLRALLGYETLVGCDLTELTDERDRLADMPTRVWLAAGATEVFRRDKRYVRSDGTVIPLYTSGAVIDRLPQAMLVITVFLQASDAARFQELRTGMDRLAEALAALRAALLHEEPTQNVLELICSWARELLGANHAGLMDLVEPDLLCIRAVDGGSGEEVVGLTWPVGHPRFSESLMSGLATRYQVDHDELQAVVDRYPGVRRAPEQLFVAMAPVLNADRARGALIASRASGPFDDQELALLELFASEVSEALTVAQLRTDLERLALTEDRERIARNLHDEVIQDLIGVRLGLVHLLQRTVDDDMREQLGESLAQLDLVTRRARDVVAGLEEGASVDDFRDTLRSITSRKAQHADIGWSVEIAGGLERLADDERVEIMRVLNEAVSNVVRHSDATQVGVVLSISRESAQLDIEDDGIGFDLAEHAVGMGLRNLNVRAMERGGTFEISASSDGGTHLCWSIPLRNQA